MADDKTILIKLDVDINPYVDNVIKAEKEVDKLKQKQEELRNQIKELPKDSKGYEELTKKIKAYDSEIRVANNELKQAQKTADNVVKSNKAQVGSYEELYRQYLDAEVKLKTLSGTIQTNADGTITLTDEYKKQSAEVRKLKDGLLEFNAGIKDGRLNVGNYAEGFKQAFAETRNFGGGLTTLTSAIGGVQNAVAVTRSGIDSISAGFQAGSEAVNSFSMKFQDGMEYIVAGGGSIGEAEKEMGNLAKTTTITDRITKVFTNNGVSGMKLLKIAIASTGFGILLVAVGSLITYFTKFQSGIDRLKVAFAGVGAVVDTIVGVFGTLGEALATFDFSKVTQGFSGMGDAIKKNVAESVALEKAKQDLELRDIKAIELQQQLKLEAEDLRLIAEDKTKSDKERLDALKKAGELEKQIIANQLKNEQLRLDILQRTFNQAQKNGQANREQLKELEEEKAKVRELADAYADKDKEIAVEGSKLQKSANAERLNAQIGIEQNKLKILELGGKSSASLERKIAKEQRDLALQDSTLSNEQRLKIESDYQVALAEINAKFREKRLQEAEERRKIIQDALLKELNLIIDGRQREIAIESAQTQFKLKEIKGNSEAERKLKEQILLESALKIVAIEDKYAKEQSDERKKRNEEALKDLQVANDKLAEQRLTSLQQQQSDALRLLAEGGASPEQINALRLEQERIYKDESLKIEQERLNGLLQLQNTANTKRLAEDKAYFDEKKSNLFVELTAETISQEEFNNRIAEIDKEQNKKLLETTQQNATETEVVQKQVEDNKVKITLDANQQIVNDAVKTAELKKTLAEIELNQTSELISGLKELFESDTQNRKAYKEALKVLSIAEIGINVYKEISGYWAGVGKDATTTGTLAAPLSAGFATALTITAIARAIANIGKVTKYEEGGYTIADAMNQYSPKVANGFSGGFVNNPTLWSNGSGFNLAGEKGSEYVAPNWMVKSNPSLFASLEQWRATGVRQFADGGFTSTTITNPIMQTSAMLEGAIAKGFASAPSPIVSVTEINDVQNRVVAIESRASL
jgi:hypothetical protein